MTPVLHGHFPTSKFHLLLFASTLSFVVCSELECGLDSRSFEWWDASITDVEAGYEQCWEELGSDLERQGHHGQSTASRVCEDGLDSSHLVSLEAEEVEEVATKLLKAVGGNTMEEAVELWRFKGQSLQE